MECCTFHDRRRIEGGDESSTASSAAAAVNMKEEGGNSRTKLDDDEADAERSAAAASRGERGETEDVKGPKTGKDGDHFIDIKSAGGRGSPNNAGNLRSERVCRICHLASEPSHGGSQLIQLGCDCKAELGISHPRCADTWFKQRGNRLCEICGKTAKNISGIDDTRVLIMELNEMRLMATTSYSSGESSHRCKRSFCNCLLACLVLAFVLPWFFRANMF